jgi:hypothetical protein
LTTGLQNQTTLDYLIAHQNRILGFPAIHRIKIRQRYDYEVDNSTARFVQIVHFDHSREQTANFILEGPLVKWPSTKGCVSRVLQISMAAETICKNCNARKQFLTLWTELQGATDTATRLCSVHNVALSVAVSQRIALLEGLIQKFRLRQKFRLIHQKTNIRQPNN